jgi:hypothetical protein
MKKVGLILLLNIYALASFGIGIRQFYCCGKLKSTDISFARADLKKCSNGDESDGCCKTKYQTFKVNDSHVPGTITTIPAFADSKLFITPFDISLPVSESNDIANASHAPPLYHITPIYILNCVYRI